MSKCLEIPLKCKDLYLCFKGISKISKIKQKGRKMNQVILCGNLTKDFELTKANTGATIARNFLALNKVRILDNGDKTEHTDFIPITLFNKNAENAAKYLKKGNKLLIRGEIRTSIQKDAQTQEKNYFWTVVVQSFEFMQVIKENEAKPQNTNPQKQNPNSAVEGQF